MLARHTLLTTLPLHASSIGQPVLVQQISPNLELQRAARVVALLCICRCVPPVQGARSAGFAFTVPPSC